MVNGINENVEAFGRMFHVQTEVAGDEQPVIRTRVFVDGAVIAHRESRFQGEHSALADRAQSQHRHIVENLVQRTVGLEALMASSDLTRVPPSKTQRREPPVPKEANRPDPTSDPRLLSSVRVRQLLGPFSLQFHPSPYHDAGAVRARVESAATLIDGIMTAPHFSEVRLDEQVRFFDLRERIAAWRGDGRSPEVASEILLAMVAFAAHLRRISDRRELVAFDHKLLTWAMAETGRHGATPELLEDLRALAGRDAELDALLAQPEAVEAQHLLEVLMALIDRTLP